VPPFTILHICMGNICRSPMAEHLTALALRKRLGDAVDGGAADSRYLNHGAGTGTWHIGDPMDPGAARQISERGGDPDDFRARHVTAELVDSSDLVLTATGEQLEYVLRLCPDAAPRAFVLGEFGRLLRDADLSALPPADSDASAYARGVALVAAVDAVRADGRGGRRRSTVHDDLQDPYGMPNREFARAADTIEITVVPLADALVGAP
jgi:protein-tyrosine phosphatase